MAEAELLKMLLVIVALVGIVVALCSDKGDDFYD